VTRFLLDINVLTPLSEVEGGESHLQFSTTATTFPQTEDRIARRCANEKATRQLGGLLFKGE
jgi:hypothetical protein